MRPSLLAMLSTEEVSRFISPPPTTVEGFERFIAWTHRERVAGNYVCFGIVPEGLDAAIGLFQVRSLQPGFGTAEWGFAMGSAFWGTGLFVAAATLVVNFAVDVLGVQRLEARAVVANGRGNGALRKIGAVQEGVLRRSFLRRGHYHDQVLWSILAADWQPATRGGTPRDSLTLDVSDFDFALPEELIAQDPAAERGGSRLLAMQRATGAVSHHQFSDLPSLLRAGDLLVVNDTRVFPARLIGVRLPGGGAAECFLVRPADHPRHVDRIGASRPAAARRFAHGIQIAASADCTRKCWAGIFTAVARSVCGPTMARR